MKLEVANSTNFKQPRVTSLRREEKTVSVSAWKVTNFLSTFLWPQSDQHKGSFGIWGFSHFECFSADVLAENDVTDIMGV